MSNQQGSNDTTDLRDAPGFPDLPVIATIVTGEAVLEEKVATPSRVSTTRGITSVVIDSRLCETGSLFIALPGEVGDGERYVYAAKDNGAVAAIVRHRRAPDGGEWPLPVIVVTDALAALHALAIWYVDARLSRVTRIGVTGSNGKTTTKELIVSLVSSLGSTFGSKGNYNSETGLPLSVFATPHDVEYAVYEMAMSAPGEMEALARIVRPQIAVITNIGTAHIGRVGSKDAIAREKKAIASQFTGGETIVLPADDEYAPFLSRDIRGSVAWFGPTTQGATIGPREGGTTTLSFDDGTTVTIPLAGGHNAMNALAALRVTELLGMERSSWPQSVELSTLPEGRAQRIPLHGGGLLLHDAYNANLDSMYAAIAMAEDSRRGEYENYRLVFILGDMYELGETGASAHRSVLERAVAASPRTIYVVGELFRDIVEKDRSILVGDFSDRAIPCVAINDIEEGSRVIPRALRHDDIVLLKGSRGIGLERLIPAIRGVEVTRA